MPTSVKSLLSRLRLVKLVRVDNCLSPASPTPVHKPVGVDDAGWGGGVGGGGVGGG